MSVTITRDEWLAEIQRLAEKRPSAEGLSAGDMADQLGMSRATMRAWLPEQIRQGKIKYLGRDYRRAIDGTMRPVPVYQPAKQGRAK